MDKVRLVKLYMLLTLIPRYLIESATGVFTGSVFNDQAIASAGHYGERVQHLDGSTILQKTHHR